MRTALLRLAVLVSGLVGASARAEASAELRKVKVPGHEVEVSIEIPGFKPADELPNPERTLLFGEMAGEAVISVLWEENFPFVPAQDCPKVFSKEKGYKAFTVGDKTGCQYQLAVPGLFEKSQCHGFLATPDFLFTIHISRTFTAKAPGGRKELKRGEVDPIVKSLAVMGKADRGRFRLPEEVYAFRDEAAGQKGNQLDWVKKQCGSRPDAWAAHFYLGELAYSEREIDPSIRGHGRAAGLLSGRAERSPKETKALLIALDSRASSLAQREEFDLALPVCLEVLRFAPVGEAEDVRAFREQALFNLACCHAKTSKPVEALEYLRQALEARPDWKERAGREELLAALRSRPEFRKLVGE